MTRPNKDKLICALDVNSIERATQLVETLDDFVGIFKVGLEYYTATNAVGLSSILTRNVDVFLDLKFHDIPNTVGAAIGNFTKFHNIKMLTVHAGGKEMIEAATKAAKGIEVIVVTVLTSVETKNTTRLVLQKTEEALEAGAAGIVCSPKEVKKVRKKFGNGFKIITPGIRFDENNPDDQKRTGTPKQAIDDGATHIVVGRPITQSAMPRNVASMILRRL